MAYVTDENTLYELYEDAKEEGHQWKEDYPEFERLMDNGLLDTIDPDLPLVNDGSLSASLFKLPKRVVNSTLKGRAKAVDRDDAYMTELANIEWEDTIIPNANTQAPFHRKWKDAVRKAAGYGGVPLVSIFTERGNYTGADFIVVQPQDMTLEPGKVSDYDSDLFFWDVYYTKSQLEDVIEQAKTEEKEDKKAEKKAKKKDEKFESQATNRWNVKELERILASDSKDDRTSRDKHEEQEDKAVETGGFHFIVIFQRGIESPFFMVYKGSKKIVREWVNPDPTGDVPVHYLYMYQDFINPYGIGIVKLAGGTQNTLDYMRQADILATQIGLKPPIKIAGDVDEVDEDSLTYTQDALWYVGGADVKREELANGVYSQLPNRISMYKTSLNQLIPTGDTSISASAGDPQFSKTPAGVKFQAANLSIDDDDMRDNLNMTYEAVAKSMINIHFANMEGEDVRKLTDDQKQVMSQTEVEFEEDSNELLVEWDKARAEFDFVVDAEDDKEQDKEKRLEALLRVAELRASDPSIEVAIEQSGRRLNVGELFSTIVQLTTDNEKILEEIEAEETDAEEGEIVEDQAGPTEDEIRQAGILVEQVMQKYGVDQRTAAAALEAERQGFPPQEIIAALGGQGGPR